MIINNLELNNFGSYEGVNNFDFNTDENKNIILIGGKNGAGKTTLFTAIRLCIYGYKAFGYQNINSYYNKISFIPQNTWLFTDTIKNNLKFANLYAKEEEIVNTCKTINSLNIINKYPLNFEEIIKGELYGI